MAKSNNSSEVIESGNIFISYNRKDTDFRRQLEGLLAEDGYNPDFDEEGIRPGEPWRERLEEMIGASDTFIIILTEHWLASENCRTELEIAEEKEKRIIPVLPRALPETPSADEAEKSVRHRVSKLNYVHFFPVRAGDGGGFYVGSRKLKAELRDNIDQLRLRRRYAERASAWKRQEDDLLSGDQLTQAESWMKKEAELDGVAPDTARYIAASQDAREDAIRNARRIRAVLATFGAFAIIAAVAAAAMSWFAIQSVNLADEDSERLTNAARNWADGKANLVANVGEEDQDESERLLSRASQSLEDGLKLVGAIDRESVRPLRVEISLDLASAELNAEDYADAWETVGAVMDLLTETEPETQAKAFLAQALLACELAKETDTRDPALPEENGTPETVLTNAPETLHPFFNAQTLAEWRVPHPQCDGTAAAICVYENNCPEPISQAPQEPEEAAVQDPLPPQSMEPDRGLGATADIPVSPADPFEIRDIYLHISGKDQREDAQALAKRLTAEGYRVLGIELIPAPDGKNRSIRYYHDRQADQAARLRTLCADFSEALGRQSWANEESYRLISLDGRYKGLPNNRVEIWF